MTEAPRRFYETVSVSPDGAHVLLDARTLHTPGGLAFAAPTRALAEAVAAEWAAQQTHVVPASMPLTQLGFAAAALGEARRDELVLHVAKYAATDLVCHRAEGPAGLVARQAEAWEPLLSWFEDAMGVRCHVVHGVIAAPANAAVSARVAERTKELDAFALTALSHATGLAGSAVIAFALLHRRIEAKAAFAAAALDELWSLEHWGEDAEARARLERLRRDISSVATFMAALSE